MTRNMSSADRTIRFLIAVVVVALYLTHRISGTLAIILGLLAVAFFFSSVVGWCPGYAPFGFSTRLKDP